jgi:3-hydroxy-5-methyl-1-naphthoate 3-O-methyltransferase
MTFTARRLSVQKPTLDKFPKEVLAAIDIQKAFIISRLIVAAERLQVFRLLHGKRMRAEAVGRALKIHKFYLQAFLDSLVSLGLLRTSRQTYGNTPFAEKYFIAERSIYWTRQYSKECAEAYEALTVLEEALRSGKSYEAIKGLKKPSYTEAMQRDRRQAEDFTQMLFHFHQEDAEALARYLDLSKRQAVLDVAGGSGVMSIALAKTYPHLRGCVLDIPAVSAIAAGNISRAGLSGRVGTLAGDIHHSLPTGYDVIMFCDIGPLPKQLLSNAYKRLPANGLLVVVDRYLSEDGTKPLDRLVEYFAGSSFGLATWRDMVQAIKACGFQAVKAKNVYHDVWFITAVKRARTAGQRVHSA